MGSSRPLTLALPCFAYCLLLLAAGMAFVYADNGAEGGQIGQTKSRPALPGNNPPLFPSPITPFASAHPDALATSDNAGTHSGHSQPPSQEANANAATASSNTASINLQTVDGQFVLEARQAPLAQILQAITEKTGAQIHYSVLPEAPVSATCAGKTSQALMECLVAKQIGLVAHQATKTKPAEFWLLGSSVGSCRAVTVAAAPAQIERSQEEHSNVPAAPTQEEIEQSEKFLEEARAKDPNVRSMAIQNLSVAGIKDDPRVEQAIKSALKDGDPNVRSQAVNGIAQRGGDTILEDLSEAFKDQDPNVRLIVLGNIHNDSALLHQAVNDSNKMVREFAQAKLNDLAAKASGINE